jgi:hypothetical protein
LGKETLAVETGCVATARDQQRGHEELAKLAAQGAPDPKALADLRNRYDTDQLSTLTTRA